MADEPTTIADIFTAIGSISLGTIAGVVSVLVIVYLVIRFLYEGLTAHRYRYIPGGRGETVRIGSPEDLALRDAERRDAERLQADKPNSN